MLHLKVSTPFTAMTPARYRSFSFWLCRPSVLLIWLVPHRLMLILPDLLLTVINKNIQDNINCVTDKNHCATMSQNPRKKNCINSASHSRQNTALRQFIKSCLFHNETKRQNSAVGTVTRLRDARPSNHGLIPSKDEIFLFSDGSRAKMGTNPLSYSRSN
jgi:hypothetical protein